MSLSYVNSTAVSGTTLTIPTGAQVGDIVIMFAFNNASTTLPTIPSGWFSLGNPTPANACAGLVAYTFVPAGGVTVGTWTTATGLLCGVYRGSRGGMAAISTTGTGTSISVPAVVSGALTTGEDMRIVMAGHVSATNVNTGPSGVGLYNRNSPVTSLYLGDSNGGADAASYSAVAWTVNTSAGYVGFQIGLKIAPNSFNNYHAVRVQDGMSTSGALR